MLAEHDDALAEEVHGVDVQVEFDASDFAHLFDGNDAQGVVPRDELVEIAGEVANIAAKHEGGDPEVDSAREHPSDILDYFVSKEDIISQGLMGAMEQNYLDKHDALNRTAAALVKAGIDVLCAGNLHG